MSSTPIVNNRQKLETRQGMESIKRQMDNLADMVNDLQLQMNKKKSTKFDEEAKLDTESKTDEDEFSDHVVNQGKGI